MNERVDDKLWVTERCVRECSDENSGHPFGMFTIGGCDFWGVLYLCACACVLGPRLEMAAFLHGWVLTPALVAEAAVLGAVVLFAMYVVPGIWKGVQQYLVFRSVPADPEQHWLLGHTPRVSA